MNKKIRDGLVLGVIAIAVLLITGIFSYVTFDGSPVTAGSRPDALQQWRAERQADLDFLNAAAREGLSK